MSWHLENGSQCLKKLPIDWNSNVSSASNAISLRKVPIDWTSNVSVASNTLAIGSSTVVEKMPLNPKIEGLNPVAGTRRHKMALYNCGHIHTY
jgi:hypothetical protein